MKIVVAPDKFKGSLDARAVAEALARGIARVGPAEVVVIPMADGGDGTVEALIGATGGRTIEVSVTGPLGEPVIARYGMLGDRKTAVMEMAAASGLMLVPSKRRDPLVTTTRGVGEMILDAKNRGAQKIVMGIGGSATNDGGAGMAQALGIGLLDSANQPIGAGGAALADLCAIDMRGLDDAVRRMRFVVACDVDNPLLGPRGASAVYGPQKGATPEMIATLDSALSNYATVIKKYLGFEVISPPGAGAAGGLGAGLMAFLGAELRSGIELVMETGGLYEALDGADLLITGEGKMDEQTLMGKVPSGVAKVAQAKGITVFAVTGSYSVPTASFHGAGIDAVFAAQIGPATLEQSMREAARNLESVGEQIYRVFLKGRQSAQDPARPQR